MCLAEGVLAYRTVRTERRHVTRWTTVAGRIDPWDQWSYTWVDAARHSPIPFFGKPDPGGMIGMMPL